MYIHVAIRGVHLTQHMGAAVTEQRHALAELPNREGAVFSLHYFEGMALREIAESLDIRYAAAGTALSRARSKLNRALCDTTEDK